MKSANVPPINFIAAKEIDGHVEHDEAGVKVEGGFADLMIKLGDPGLPALVEDDKFIVFSALGNRCMLPVLAQCWP